MSKKKVKTEKDEKKKKHISVSMVEHISLAVSYGFLFLFLVINIVFSQELPPEYFRIASGDTRELVEFFKHARKLSAFSRIFPENKNLFSQYEGEIYADERSNRELITTLEEVLVVNPKSRDVLYSLALLYDKNGDELQSAEYLRQARAIDPEVGR